MASTIFSFYGRIACSLYGRFIENSFAIWGNVKIILRIVDNAAIIYPLVYSAFDKVMRHHWSNTTSSKVLHVLNSIQELDPFVFGELSRKKKNPDPEPPTNPFNKELKSL